MYVYVIMHVEHALLLGGCPVMVPEQHCPPQELKLPKDLKALEETARQKLADELEIMNLDAEMSVGQQGTQVGT